jgi:uncharacterized protein (TIGR02145 family)
MKKIISCLAITVLLFACSKTEQPLPADQELAREASLKGQGGNTINNVTTNPASSILSFTAVSGGSVSSSGGGNTVKEKGICYNTSGNPTTGDSKVPSGSGSGSFSCILVGLSGSTTYYVRAYAIKKEGTAYGNEISFTTATCNCGSSGTFTDIDGNVYHAITIGSQEWMLENLKTTKYRDGTDIPNVTDDTWWSQTTGAYCNYNNDESYVATYGRLYNWYAVDNEHNLAPEGWHVPSEEELMVLVNYFGGGSVAGYGLKEAGLAHWLSPNLAYNSCGFAAIPGGYRTAGTSFAAIGMRGTWWSSSAIISSLVEAQYIRLHNDQGNVYGIGGGWSSSWKDKAYGYSVRCIKDQNAP